MQISGSLLTYQPACTDCGSNQGRFDYRQPSSERYNDAPLRNRQQAVEYVFDGKVLDEVAFDQQQRNRYQQSIDPANLGAISSYEITAQAASPQAQRQGRLVDFFT